MTTTTIDLAEREHALAGIHDGLPDREIFFPRQKHMYAIVLMKERNNRRFRGGLGAIWDETAVKSAYQGEWVSFDEVTPEIASAISMCRARNNMDFSPEAIETALEYANGR